jgi:predicted DNA-binding transcriptional regulator YafY
MEPGWFPGSVRWTAREVAELIPVLLRAPQSATRDAAIERILRVIPRERVPARTREAIEAPTRTTTEQEHEALVVDAALRRHALFVRYYSTERDAVSARVVSVQRVVSDTPVRFVGWCHERNELLWFRVDNVRTVRVDRAEHFHEADPTEVERFVSESVEGFRQMKPVSCVFTVRDPEARWAQRNLPAARQGQYVIEAIEGGVRVQITTAGVVPLARWLVGVGAAGRAESAELAAQVEALARGALHEAQR